MSEPGPTPPTPRVRVVVDRADAPRCGLAVGDAFVIDGSRLVGDGSPVCPLALSAVASVLAARQYPLPADDWLVRKPYLTCVHAEEGVVLRLEAAS
ncbi:TIGR04076 family protein [Nocardioides sp. zg-DK7169]|uniref:TIGR04076 family protein n=1 Tax=Nocardioides sp. zg-DK7169 TaxID=2736600 RepID=UPI0015553F7E|nr:TIGR04076 family protein [Nocardioides sp. zg-DK7169]NPC98727.1 TIGR04076 family protein [Nocardioides sp. zg-DK7169]